MMDDLDSVTCSVCLEVYEKPIAIDCGHVFCLKCLERSTCLAQVAEPHCPLCRAVFNPKKQVRAVDVEKKITSHKTICKQCLKKISVSQVRLHLTSCSADAKQHEFQPVAPTTQTAEVNVPNRSTFPCPYCGVQNLTSHNLILHCNNHHSESRAHVVCPICSSMPWGDRHQTSSNFIAHLNLRHKFEYDTYVDFEKDDDAMLQAALKASMEET